MFDVVGEGGVSLEVFTSKLDALGDRPVTVEINSPGGDVFAGIGIYNALITHPGNVKVSIFGLAASAASIIAMGGDGIEIAGNAMMMIHNSWMMTVGNAGDHVDSAGILAKIDNGLAGTYQKRSGQPLDVIKNWMAAETWFSAEEAKQFGLVNSVANATAPQARFDLSAFKNTPAQLANSAPHQSRSLPTRSDVERYLRNHFPIRAAARISRGEWPTREDRQSIAAKLEANLAELRTVRGH